MDAFFADILGDAKAVSQKAGTTIRRNVGDDFRGREKFYSGLIKKNTNLCNNNVTELYSKGGKGYENAKSSISKTTLPTKSDKSTQGQNLSFNELCQLAKTNKKPSDNRVRKTSLKKDKNLDEINKNITSPPKEPKVPKLIIRKTDYTIKSKESDVPKHKEHSTKSKMENMHVKQKPSDKEISSKDRNKHISTTIKRKAEDSGLPSKSITTKVAKIPHKSLDRTYIKDKKDYKESRHLKSYAYELTEDSEDSMDDFIDDDNDDLPTRTEFEEALRSVSRYDKDRWRKNELSIKEDKMTSSFSDIRKEEKKSLKIALKEDLKEKIKGARSL
uniref:Protein SPT2 homolog n=1 Tax=Strongyloides papillosus TaxID=174720 RepID=A0A0N5BYW2_STREA